MALPRFFCPVALTSGATIELPAALAHHAVRVLRLKPDAHIILFNGDGGQYPGRLIIDEKRAYAELGPHDPVERELPGKITLVQGAASGDKMDWIIEKAVELGASKVVPIAAQRSVLQLKGERLGKRMDHWRRITQAASEQCGRNRIMDVQEPCSLQQYLATAAQTSSALFCHPAGQQTLAVALKAARQDLVFLVGPEGGWSDEEQALVERHGLLPVRFGTRVLRTETAGLALISATCALRGWE